MSGLPNDLTMPEQCYRCGQSDCVNNNSSESKPPALMASCRPGGSQPTLPPLYDEEELPLAIQDAVISFSRNMVASRSPRPETPRTSQTQTPDTRTPSAPPTQPTQPTQPPPRSMPEPSPVPPGVIVIKPTHPSTPLIKIHPVHTGPPLPLHPTGAAGAGPGSSILRHSPPALTRCPVGRAKTTVKVGETTSLLIRNPRLRRALDSSASSSPAGATQQLNWRRGGGVVEVEGNAGSLTQVVRDEALLGDARGSRQLRGSGPRTGDTVSMEEPRPKSIKKKEKQKRECIGWIFKWFTSFVSTRKVADGTVNHTNAEEPDGVSVQNSEPDYGRVHGRSLDSGRPHDTEDDDDEDIRHRDNLVLVNFLREGLSDVDSESE